MSTHSNRLAVLAADVRSVHREITRGALALAEHALAVGRMLTEAKESLPHGEWEAWLTEQTGLSSRTARRYMQIARSGLKTATVADLGLRGATEWIAKKSAPGAPGVGSELPFPLPQVGECLNVKALFAPAGLEIDLAWALVWPSEHSLDYFDFLVFDSQYPQGGLRGGGCVYIGNRPITAEGLAFVLGKYGLTGAPSHPTGELRVSVDQIDAGRLEQLRQEILSQPAGDGGAP